MAAALPSYSGAASAATMAAATGDEEGGEGGGISQPLITTSVAASRNSANRNSSRECRQTGGCSWTREVLGLLALTCHPVYMYPHVGIIRMLRLLMQAALDHYIQDFVPSKAVAVKSCRTLGEAGRDRISGREHEIRVGKVSSLAIAVVERYNSPPQCDGAGFACVTGRDTTCIRGGGILRADSESSPRTWHAVTAYLVPYQPRSGVSFSPPFFFADTRASDNEHYPSHSHAVEFEALLTGFQVTGGGIQAEFNLVNSANNTLGTFPF
ncbi:hypothetical protein B0H16DRAFT_1778619 [Mycena metata]|uniref:Uncharacterized protein n=1 Tax=Mycena metata TaxID=1033252 RepID=A0AAD7MQL4_9AGAR|nr:hypothetical protein B0H16DRAFT_1778619 [Mycena metata]